MGQAGNYACFNRVGRDYDNGISRVACFAASAQGTYSATITSTLSLTSSDTRSEADPTFLPPIEIQTQCFPFYIAEFAQPIAEFILEQLGVGET